MDSFTFYVKEMFRNFPECTELNVADNGIVKFRSYINNLNNVKYVSLFEKTLERMIPHFEKVLGVNLKKRKCQVIVKVDSIHLTPENPTYKGGSWHIEGMPYEHIIATGLHYLEVENITPSFLEFQKPVVVNEEWTYPQNDTEYTNVHYGVTDHYQGHMNRYLGLIKATQGASVVFPNTLQHHVKEFKLADKTKLGLRTIIAFFLIDPDRRIVSTSDIPEQHDNITLKDAKEYRELLMHQRKYFVDEINQQVYEREFSLCEN